MTESNFSKKLTEAIAVRKVGYEKMQKLAGKVPTTEPLSLDEPLSANKSVSVKTAFWLDAKWEHHKKILDAFRRFQLDPENPWHWRLLLESFIEVGLKGPGPKTKLVRNKFSELPEHITRLRREDPNLKSHSEIARRLRSDKRYKTLYKPVAPRTLRGHVGALDWGSVEELLREAAESVTKVSFPKSKKMRTRHQ